LPLIALFSTVSVPLLLIPPFAGWVPPVIVTALIVTETPAPIVIGVPPPLIVVLLEPAPTKLTLLSTKTPLA